MNRISSYETRKWRSQLRCERDLSKLLDLVMALDRIVVELSMQIYEVPRRERFAMRKHNRRLHHVVRKRLPGLLAPRNPL